MEALLLGEQMAVGLIIQFSGVDAAKYDAIVKEAGLKGKKALASGYRWERLKGQASGALSSGRTPPSMLGYSESSPLV